MTALQPPIVSAAPAAADSLATGVAPLPVATSAPGDGIHPTASPADTARNTAFGPDSLALQPHADTLVPATVEIPRPLYRDTTAAALFGSRATAVAYNPARQAAPAVDPLLQGAVLLLTALYMLLVYRHAADIRLLFQRLTQDLRTENPHTAEPAGNRQSRLLRICSLLALLCASIAAVRCLPLPPGLPLAALFAAAALLGLAVVGYQRGVLMLAGALTLTRPFTEQLLRLRRTFLSLGLLVATPPLLLFALGSGRGIGLWSALCAGGALLTLLLYLKKSVDLFLAKKVSILHWFLYLCVVEIFPYSLLWLLALRA